MKPLWCCILFPAIVSLWQAGHKGKRPPHCLSQWSCPNDSGLCHLKRWRLHLAVLVGSQWIHLPSLGFACLKNQSCVISTSCGSEFHRLIVHCVKENFSSALKWQSNLLLSANPPSFLKWWKWLRAFMWFRWRRESASWREVLGAASLGTCWGSPHLCGDWLYQLYLHKEGLKDLSSSLILQCCLKRFETVWDCLRLGREKSCYNACICL